MYYASRFERCVITAFLSLLSVVLHAGAIHQAVRAHDLVSLNRILERDGQDAANSLEAGRVTALHLAAATDQPEAIELLTGYTSDLSPVNKDGFTPLHWAASRNAAEATKALIEAGAQIDPRSANGLTPLHFAAHKQNTQVAQILLDAGADPKLETVQGYRPLHLALKRNPESPLAHLLAEAMVEGFPHPGPPPPLPTDTQPEEAAQPALAEPMNEAVPGTFLNVPLGLGQSLAFVWIEPLSIWFGKYEITNEQFRRFQANHSSRSYEGFTLDAPQQPAVYTSWDDAAAFCSWLNQSYSNRIPVDTEFRLPTENEWVYVASCGQLRQYPWGNEWPPRYGNYSDLTARDALSSWRGIDGYQDGHPVTCKVQDSGMNEWGIFGMAGNVWEWCDDWFDSSQRAKTRHGGSWDFDTRKGLAIASRGFDRPDAKYDTIGFRLVVGPRTALKPPPPVDSAPEQDEASRKWAWGKGAKPPKTVREPLPETQTEPDAEIILQGPPLPERQSDPNPLLLKKPDAEPEDDSKETPRTASKPEPEPEPEEEPEPEPEPEPQPEPPRLHKRDVDVPLYVIPHG